MISILTKCFWLQWLQIRKVSDSLQYLFQMMYSALVISLSPNDKYMMSMRENEWWIIALWQFWYWMVQHFEIDHMLIDHNQIVGLVWQTWTLNDWVILRSVCHSVSVIWPKYCRCGLKHYIINQSINHWAIWAPFKKKVPAAICHLKINCASEK